MISDTMAIPIIKRAVKVFHDKHDRLKKKGKQEQERVRQELYKVKGKVQCDLGKSMGRPEAAPPFIVVRRTGKGPRGQPKGTIATSLKEIDAMCWKYVATSTKAIPEIPRRRRKLTLETTKS